MVTSKSSLDMNKSMQGTGTGLKNYMEIPHTVKNDKYVTDFLMMIAFLYWI